MSASGHKRTKHSGAKLTFVRSCPKADKCGRNWIVRYVPITDMGLGAQQTTFQKTKAAAYGQPPAEIKP
jgi:hypothetical protein